MFASFIDVVQKNLADRGSVGFAARIGKQPREVMATIFTRLLRSTGNITDSGHGRPLRVGSLCGSVSPWVRGTVDILAPAYGILVRSFAYPWKRAPVLNPPAVLFVMNQLMQTADEDCLVLELHLAPFHVKHVYTETSCTEGGGRPRR